MTDWESSVGPYYISINSSRVNAILTYVSAAIIAVLGFVYLPYLIGKWDPLALYADNPSIPYFSPALEVYFEGVTYLMYLALIIMIGFLVIIAIAYTIEVEKKDA